MWGLSLNASAHGYEIDSIILYVHLLMLVLFLGWSIFFITALVRFNRRANPKANYAGVQNHVSSKIEVAVVVIEAILLIGFSIPFWAKHVNAFPTRTDVVNVRVVAEQFAWNIHYPGKDGIFGKSNPKLVDNQSNPMGIDMSDPNAQDDFVTVNQLHLPIGRPAVILLSTKDVIHSFRLNAMRVTQDVLPGMSVKTWFTPTKINSGIITIKELRSVVSNPQDLFDLLQANGYIDGQGKITAEFKGVQNYHDLKLNDKYKRQQAAVYGLMREAVSFEITCAQLCGIGHYRMRGYLTIETPEGYDKWVSEQSPIGSSSGESGADSFWN
jgi:cytochrome c oxidase subunit 2